MSQLPKPGGNWDRQDLNRAIRANEGIRTALDRLAELVPHSVAGQAAALQAALLAGEQLQALRDMEMRWWEWRRRRGEG